MEDIDGGLHPAVDGQSLDEDEMKIKFCLDLYSRSQNQYAKNKNPPTPPQKKKNKQKKKTTYLVTLSFDNKKKRSYLNCITGVGRQFCNERALWTNEW